MNNLKMVKKDTNLKIERNEGEEKKYVCGVKRGFIFFFP
jgi:hypothetical protein